MKFNIKFVIISTNFFMEYSKLAYYATLFANDLKHIHIHAAGESMEDIRTEADTLFYKTMRDYEDFSKLAIMYNDRQILEVRQP